jgi:ABC-type uncharacterized transport system involved in gliding motility auxiliary subunit
LHEYVRLANGKLRLEIIDPEPFSEAEDRAVGYGLQGVPLSDGESIFYFGLVASGPTDERSVIPFLSTDRESFLEYDLTKLIHQVAWPKKPVVGMLDTLNLETPRDVMVLRRGGNSPVALEQVKQAFDVRTLDKTVDRIPDDVDVLLLIQPMGLSDRTRYAIDQFVLRGGRVLAFLDPLPEETGGGAPVVKDAGLEKLLAAWGVEMDTGKVVGDLQLARRVQYQRAGHVYAAQYPAWVDVPQEDLDNTDIVTTNLGSLNLASAGALMAKKGASTQFLPLVHTTANAALIDTARLGMGADLQALLRDFQPTGTVYSLAARITGPVKTAFPDGAPKVSEKEGEAKAEAAKDVNDKDLPAHLSESKEPVNLILVADTDLLQDRFWVQVQNLLGIKLATPSAANGSLLVNALDNLSGDNDLISVRNRGQFSRPFTRISELRQSAELQYLAKERELMARLDQTEQRLNELERGKQGGQAGSGESLILSTAQQQELENFRQEKLRIRKELREVRHQLGKDIESLETWIKFIHLGLIPLLVAAVGIWLGLRRARRRHDDLLIPQPATEGSAHA